MAMIDYGAIAFKNGKCIQTGMFNDMFESVGWVDTKEDTYEHWTDSETQPARETIPLRLRGNYFAYVGDEDLVVAFYKQMMVIYSRNYNYKTQTVSPHSFNRKYEYFNCTYYKWRKWVCSEFVRPTNPRPHNWLDEAKMKVTKRNGYYCFKMKYRGDRYKVYFGSGVDYPLYKKWHLVNYWRTPTFLLHKFKGWLKDKKYDFRLWRAGFKWGDE